ncbi:MAG: hypothetical protein ACQKBY_12650 [Verrucomicrobiales bacterium]
MKSTLLLLILALTSLHAQQEKPDPVEEKLREAFKSNQDEEYSQCIATLRETITLLEAKNAERAEAILPPEIEDWKGGDFKREDLSVLGGGLSVTRSYRLEEKEITIKLLKDSPLAEQWIALMGNEDLLALGGRKTKTIFGETGVVEGNKLSIVIDKRILIELTGDNDCSERDILSLARKLDMHALKKMQ